MAHNTRPLKRAQDGVAPQYYNPTTDEYEVLLGQDGAARAILYGPDGQPITNENPLEVRARLLEELLGALNATKETNPDASTATLLALLRGLLASVGKEATLAAIKDSDGIKKITDAVTVSGLENLATETKLEAVRTLVEDLKSELILVKANQLSGDQKVQQVGTIVEYETAVNAESLPAGGSRIIDWNITDEDLILVAVNIDKAPWSLIGRSMFYTQSDSYPSVFFPERSQIQTTFPTIAAPAISMFLGYVPHDGINSWGEAIEFPKIYKGAGARNDFRVGNRSDEVATVTVRIVRVWNV
jgi:hypothetical protein